MSRVHDPRRYDPKRNLWPWDLDAIEDALRVRGFRPERCESELHVSYVARHYLYAYCPCCYFAERGLRLEDREPSLMVGALMGPFCRVCDVPAEAILRALGLAVDAPARLEAARAPLELGPPRLDPPRLWAPRAA